MPNFPMTFQPKKTLLDTISVVANSVALFALILHIFNPGLARATTLEELTNAELAQIPTILAETEAGRMFHPDVKVIKADRRIRATITAYTSTPGQTDDTPFIAASGKHVYDGMIAANGLPFGTIIKIPSLYGEKEFVVDDRMNARYGYGRMDVWLDTSRAEARKFGVKRVDVEIFYPKPRELARR